MRAVVLAGRSTPSGTTGQAWGAPIGIPGEPIVLKLWQPEASEFVHQVFRWLWLPWCSERGGGCVNAAVHRVVLTTTAGLGCSR